MSSRELLDELLGVVIDVDAEGAPVVMSADFLPKDSALNTALGGGDWSPAEHREARIVNEIASLRGDFRGFVPDLLLSPAELAVEQEHDDWQKRRHDENLAQLQGKRRVK